MKLYNSNIDKVGNYKTIDTVDGTMYPNKLTDEQLASYGYYNVEYQSIPNRRYYTATQTNGIQNGKYVVGYIATEKDIMEVKQSMFKDLFEHGEKKEAEAKVDSGLGFTVEANPRALQAFTLGAKKGVTRVRDENFMPHNVTNQQMNKILSDIEDKMLTIFNTKEDKFDEILSLPTVQDCINYENFEYQYTITQADVDADLEGTLTVGQVVTRTKNKVKDW